MDKNCLDIIRNKYSSLNRAQKKIAQFILDDPSRAVNLNITGLAEASGVSESTIFRFANTIGYKGFQDFKINLAKSLSKPIYNIHNEVDKSDGPYIIMQKLLSGYEYSLKETLKLNNEENLLLAVEKIRSANKLYLFGMGGSYSYASDAEHKFIRNGINCTSNSDLHWVFMNIGLADPSDVLIVFSSSGTNKDLAEAVEYAKEKNLFVIAITSKSDSCIAKKADLVLISYGREYSIRSEAFEARVSNLFIIDTLYLLLATYDDKAEDVTINNLFKIREAIAKRRKK